MRRRHDSQPRRASQQGFVIVFVAAFLVALCLLAAFVIDFGRAYVVRDTLSQAVDGAALAAARKIALGDGQAEAAANKIFDANFPSGAFGTTTVVHQVRSEVGPDGSNLLTVSGTATVPSTLGRFAGVDHITISSKGQATRRMVDLSFVVDKSGSLGGVWSQVQAAASEFVDSFDADGDRLALTMFSTNTIVMDPIRTAGRGFDKTAVLNHLAAARSAGNTATAEGLYQGWDQLRSVPYGLQSPLRIIVLFTDGAPNAISGRFSGRGFPTTAGTLITNDFVRGQSPQIGGLYQINGTPLDPSVRYLPAPAGNHWSGHDSTLQAVFGDIPELPLQSYHPQHVSAGIPFQFKLFDPLLSGQRPLESRGAGYVDHVQNANNAARNLVEVIANAARDDSTGAHRIRIYTLGLGDLLNVDQGAVPETGSSILQRVANDPDLPTRIEGQFFGRYYFAGDTEQLRLAFQAVRSEIIRLSE